MYHGGLVARRDDGQTYLFVGDSFTPSGMDDYCMQNRDILRPGEGYEYCLRRIASFTQGHLADQPACRASLPLLGRAAHAHADGVGEEIGSAEAAVSMARNQLYG